MSASIDKILKSVKITSATIKKKIMLLATCGGDIKLTHWPSGVILAVVTVSDNVNDRFEDVQSSYDGNTLIALPTNSRPSILSIGNFFGAETDLPILHETIDLKDDVTACCYAKPTEDDGDLIVFTTKKREVAVYDLNERRVVNRYEQSPELAKTIDCTADGFTFLIGCNDSRVYVYERNGVTVNASFCVPKSNTLTSVKCHPNEARKAAASSKEGYVCVWNVDVLDVEFLRQSHANGNVNVDFRDNLFGSVGSDRLLNLYDLRASKLVHQLRHVNALTSLAFDLGDFSNLALGTIDGSLYYYDLRNMKDSISSKKLHENAVRKIAVLRKPDPPQLLGHVPASGDCQFFVNRISAGMDCDDDTLRKRHRKCSSTSYKTDFTSVYKNDANFSEISKVTLDGNSVKRLQPNVKKCDVTSSVSEILSNVDVVNDKALIKIMESEIMDDHKRIMKQLVDNMNNGYLKMRLDVSRLLCGIEKRDSKRWSKLYASLQKLVQSDDKYSYAARSNVKKLNQRDDDSNSLISCKSANS